MTQIPAERLAEMTAFAVARADAINNYSNLEQQLCACFEYLSSTDQKTAGAIFFKISAARSRRMILDELKHEKVGVIYKGYWDSLLARSGRLDETRNQVVHWAVANNIYENGAGEFHVGEPILKKPNFWSWDESTPELTKNSLEAFSRHCEILGGAFAGFLWAIRGQSGFFVVPGTLDTWREICQRPLDDPLPPDHPLYRKPK